MSVVTVSWMVFIGLHLDCVPGWATSFYGGYGAMGRVDRPVNAVCRSGWVSLTSFMHPSEAVYPNSVGTHGLLAASHKT